MLLLPLAQPKSNTREFIRDYIARAPFAKDPQGALGPCLLVLYLHHAGGVMNLDAE